MRTYPRIAMTIGADLAIKQDITLITSTNPVKPFVDVYDLRTDSATETPYALYEKDAWLLDGNYKFIPEVELDAHAGYLGAWLARNDGTFLETSGINFSFGSVHDTDGLILTFSVSTNDFPIDFTIWYGDADNVEIREDVYTDNDNPIFVTNQPVTGFKYIGITFTRINKGGHSPRLKHVDFGGGISLQGDAIVEANVTEEVNVLSTTLPACSLHLLLYSPNAAFYPINPEGDYASLTRHMPLSIYEVVGSQTLFVGMYYLETWKNTSATETELECIDIIGLLETEPFKGGVWLGSGISVPDLISLILTPLSIPYTIDDSFDAVMVKGWLPYASCRSALQQICFAVGAYVNTTRDRLLRVLPYVELAGSDTPEIAFDETKEGDDLKIGTSPIVTRVQVVAHNIYEGTGRRELLNATLSAGAGQEVKFDQPMHTLSISGATITESGANYAILNVAAPGTVVLTGLVYTDAQIIKTLVNSTPSGNEQPNLKRVEGATLVNDANVTAVATRMLDYYNRLLFVDELSLYGEIVTDGQVVSILAQYSKSIIGVVEFQDIDLAGGFVSLIRVVGLGET